MLSLLFDLSLEMKNSFVAVRFVFGKEKFYRCRTTCRNLFKILPQHALRNWHPEQEKERGAKHSAIGQTCFGVSEFCSSLE